MLTPASMTFSALVATTALLFILWHTWHYDGFKCILPTKTNWFRALMLHILFASICFFVAGGWIEVHVLYTEYYVFVLDETIPAPWQLWSASERRLWESSLYLLCCGWIFLQAVHLEEFLFWGYLIQSIRSPSGSGSSWLASGYFKAWLVAVSCSLALLFCAIQIETSKLDIMRGYLFLIGSCVSLLLATASIILCLVLPSFINAVREQGGIPEVLERLHFFAEMNWMRTVFRIAYSISFFTLSVDVFTSGKRVNNNAFWGDLLYLLGQFSIFASTCLSEIVLLPRNMTSESLSLAEENIQPMIPHKRPVISSPSSDPFHELGDRLNIDREALTSAAEPNEAYELKSPAPRTRAQMTDIDAVAPFAMAAEVPRVAARYSQFPRLPQAVQDFTSPIEVTPRRMADPAGVLVNTSQSVYQDQE